jgi:hypothetical protein
MTSARHNPTTASPLEASSDVLPSLTHPLFDVQQAQWEALLAWQQSLAKCGQDFWEQWALRYAGGLPIDG